MDVQPPCLDLPPELRLRVLSFLPPNELALSGRQISKDAAQRFSQPHRLTVHLNQELPPYFDACLAASLRQWPLTHALWLLVGSPRCGREEGVEAVWRAVQPRLFPELLRTDHYLQCMHRGPAGEEAGETPTPEVDIGSAAVAGGLAHLLPSLAQRCPGLLNPGCTLEAAARHCDLAGLQAAWALLWGRLREEEPKLPQGCTYGMVMMLCYAKDIWVEKLRSICRCMMAAAAASSTPDTAAKMDWVRETASSICGGPEVHHSASVWGAAAASGDLSRLRWLRQCGFQTDTHMAFWVLLKHADLSFIQQLEVEDWVMEDGDADQGRYVRPAGDDIYGTEAVVCAAASSPKDSAAKLRWLADRGATLGSVTAIGAAAQHGNLEALQLLLDGPMQPPADADPDVDFQAVLGDALAAAVESGSVPTASWLTQAMGCKLRPEHYRAAFRRGDLPMATWLQQAECPSEDLTLCDALKAWPGSTPGDSEALVQAQQLLSTAGWPAQGPDGEHLLVAAACQGHGCAVWSAVAKLLLPSDAPTHVPRIALSGAARAGCEVMLEAVVGLGGLGTASGDSSAACYAAAAKNGDLGTLGCLRRLGVPLGWGVLAAAVREGAPLCALQWLAEQGAVLGVSEAQGILGDLRDGRYGKNLSHREREEVVVWIQGLVDGEASGREQGERAGAGQRGVAAAGGSGRGEQSSAEAGRS